MGIYELLKLRNNLIIEKKIKKGVPNEEIVVFALPLNRVESKTPNIKWTKAGKEFVYNNSRYDLLTKTIKNDTVYFYCIHDTKEEQIMLSYKSAIQKNTDNNTKHRKTNQIFPKITIDYYCQAIDNKIFDDVSMPIYYSYIQFYKTNKIELPSPPPKSFI